MAILFSRKLAGGDTRRETDGGSCFYRVVSV